MRISEIVSNFKESLNYNAPTTWTNRGNDHMGTLTVDGVDYFIHVEIDMKLNFKVGEVSFGVIVNGTPSYNLVGDTTNSMKVFGAIGNAMTTKVIQESCDIVTFVAVDNEESRMPVYRRIARKLARRSNFGSFKEITLPDGSSMVAVFNKDIEGIDQFLASV